MGRREARHRPELARRERVLFTIGLAIGYGLITLGALATTAPLVALAWWLL